MNQNQKNINLGLVLAIALVLASKKLQRHTGVAAEDWRRELLDQALQKFNQMLIQQIQKSVAQHFDQC